MPAKRTGAAAAPASTAPKATLSSGPKTLTANASVYDIAYHVWQQYLGTTSQRTMLLDVFMAFLILVGAIQFAYCVLAGNFVCCPDHSPPRPYECLLGIGICEYVTNVV